MKQLSVRFLTVILVPLAFVCRGNAADGARVVQYSETDIIPIHAKLRYSTLIVLPAHEEILDYTTGDKDFWIINGVHNLCYVHPAKADIQSNLNLVTAGGHIYSFLLTEISPQPNEPPDLKVFVVLKTSPGDPAFAGGAAPVRYVPESAVEDYKAEAEAARTQAAEAIQQAQAQARQEITRYRENYAGRLRFDYRYKSKITRPPFSVTAIFHDDKFTYIQSNAQEKPTIYELKDGKPELVNFDYENGVYIVPEIVERGYLAIGKQRASFTRKETAGSPQE
jgi:type IV secretory pathway VirB9-like protein